MDVAIVPSWRGTDKELSELKIAAERNCRQHDNLACDDHCSHRLLGNQDSLDNLLFMRRIVNHLRAKEWDATQPV